MCLIFTPFSARAGNCKVDGAERLAFRACVCRDKFELHPQGRRRNLRKEVLIASREKEAKNGKEVKSKGNAKTPAGKSGVSGKGKTSSSKSVSKGKGNTAGSTSKKK